MTAYLAKLPWLRVGLPVVAFIGSAGIGYRLHDLTVYQPHLLADSKKQLKDVATAQRIERATTTIAQAYRDQLGAKQETIRYVTQQSVKAIPVYIPQGQGLVGAPTGRPAPEHLGDGGGGGSVPVGFGRLYDYTTLGLDPPVPAPSGEPLGAASGISLSALAETHAANSGVCLGDRAEVMAWRGWYAEALKAWAKPSK